MTKKKTTKDGKIVSVYLDAITLERIKVFCEEMTLSRSSILRMLVSEKWENRHDKFLSAVKAFDEAKSKREAELMQTGVDPLDALMVAHKET